MKRILIILAAIWLCNSCFAQKKLFTIDMLNQVERLSFVAFSNDSSYIYINLRRPWIEPEMVDNRFYMLPVEGGELTEIRDV